MSISNSKADLIFRNMFVCVEFSTKAELLRQLRAYEYVTFYYFMTRNRLRNPNYFYVKYIGERMGKPQRATTSQITL